MAKITRISYNSGNWRKPTGEARRHEASGTYNYIHGFGHEDWLFRTEWQLDGWRYAFLQGVNKSHRRLVMNGEVITVTLFAVEPDRHRRYIATIRDVECLSDEQAENAVRRFKEMGWYQTMLDEIREVGGNPDALGNSEFSKHILNVRFRLENVRMFPADVYAQAGDPILRLNRYQLYNIDADVSDIPRNGTSARGRSGTAEALSEKTIRRRAIPSCVYSPEHVKMQAQLMRELKQEYPDSIVFAEQDFVDVTLKTAHERVLFEIKSDLLPRSVLRQALGQLLEYAYYPRQYTDELPLRLVVVGRSPLSALDRQYLDLLRHDFGLPVEYRVVSI